MAFENSCSCDNCAAARAQLAGKPYRWIKLDDIGLQAKLSEMEPIMLCEPGTDDEPMITDCDADRATLIVESVRAEMKRRAAGDVPPEVIGFQARERYLMLCRAAHAALLAFKMLDKARECLDKAAQLAAEHPTAITETDIRNNLARVERTYETVAAQAGRS